MNLKQGLTILFLLVAVSALSVQITKPVNNDVRRGFVSYVVLVQPTPDCSAYIATANITKVSGTQRTFSTQRELQFRGVSPEGIALGQTNGQGLWSGYWDGTGESGTHEIVINVYENCANGTIQQVVKQVNVNMQGDVVEEGLAGSLSRTGSVAMSAIIAIFGVDLAQIVNPNTSVTLIDEFGGMSFPLLIFGFVLPFILSFAILYDMFFLVGFFRPITARIIAFIIALLFSRMQGFGALYGILFNVFANFWISMLSLLFTMMVLYWVLGHLIWGYRFASEINKEKNAMEYLHKIGDHLDKLEKRGGGK